MKKGKTLQELAIEVDRQAKMVQDYCVDTRRMHYENENLSIDNTFSFVVNEHAHSQIANRLRISQSYYDIMRKEAPHLLEQNINHWFQSKPNGRYVRTLDNRVRAFLSDSFRPLDNYRLMEIAIPKLQKLSATVESAEITERRMYIKAVFKQMEEAVVVGDVVRMGISITNSEVGAGSLEIAPFIERLVCTNGMVVPDRGLTEYHVGRRLQANELQGMYKRETLKADDEVFWMKVQDVMSNVVTEENFKSIINDLRKAKNIPIVEDPIKATKVIANKYTMTNDEENGVLKQLILGGDLSTYGLVNAVTRFSQDIEDYDRATDFERIGGKILLNSLN